MQKFWSSVLATVSAIGLVCNPVAAISIGVSPPRFELKLDQKKATTQIFKVVNRDSKPATFKIYLMGWTLDEKNQIKRVASSEQSLDQWIIVNPLQFTLAPGKTQTVRFAVRPRVKPQPGEHRAFIFVEEIASPEDTKKQGGNAGVKVIGRFGVAVYGYVGDVQRVAKLNDILVNTKSNPITASFDISSQGTAYVRMNGQYTIWQATKYPGANATKVIAEIEKPKPKFPDGVVVGGSLPKKPVLPNTRRQVLLRLPDKLPPGKYVLDINGELNGVQIDQGIPFTVPQSTATIPQPKTQPRSSNNSSRTIKIQTQSN
ncbi:molecular chaperone [Mastigocladus laminosus UU774]|nr:molecular chaperone [Mastigocladus laminosus UU774]